MESHWANRLLSSHKRPSAAWAFAVVPFDERKERRWLWNGHDRSKRQWITMSVMTVRDSTDGMAENLDRRLWNVFVVLRRARLTKILQVPWHLLTGLNIQFWADARKLAKGNERCVRA